MVQSKSDECLGLHDIAEDLRQRIVEGELPPGERLPGHRELVQRYDSSGVTVQRAMELLIKQGFVESIPRKGRFVSQRPPHSHRVGVVFPGRPEKIRSYRWTRYLAAVRAATRRINQENSWDLVPYFDIEPFSDGRLTESYRSLMEDVQSDRLAGLIFSYSPHHLHETDLLGERPLPMVICCGGQKPWGPTVGVDRDAVLDKAVSHLIGKNRSRLAWMMIMKQDPRCLRPRLRELQERYRFYSPTRWIQPMDPYNPQWIQHSLEVLLSGRADERPDGLVVMDDHLVGPTVKALKTLKVEVPETLSVVGYWNFPLDSLEDVPVTRLGMDTEQQIRSALGEVRKIIHGNLTADHTEIEPIFAEEFEKRYSTDAYVRFEASSSGTEEGTGASSGDVEPVYEATFQS